MSRVDTENKIAIRSHLNKISKKIDLMKEELSEETLGKRKTGKIFNSCEYTRLEKQFRILKEEFFNFFEDVRMTFIDIKGKDDERKDYDAKT